MASSDITSYFSVTRTQISATLLTSKSMQQPLKAGRLIYHFLIFMTTEFPTGSIDSKCSIRSRTLCWCWI